MIRSIIYGDADECFEGAKEHLFRISGISNERKNTKHLRDIATITYQKGKKGLNLKAITVEYDNSIFNNHRIEVNNHILHCNYFNNIEKDKVKKVVFYLLTVGRCNNDNPKDLKNGIYADMWGTSFIETFGEKLQEKLMNEFKNDGLFLSNNFGPGYFGMSVLASLDIYRIVNGGEIGVNISETGLLLPEKSCSGIYFEFKELVEIPSECRDCLGNPSGCSYCNVKNRRNI